MANFLNCSAVTYHLESLINESVNQLVLVTPYEQIGERMRKLLLGSAAIKKRLIYGKDEIRKGEKHFFGSIPNLEVRFCKNLHAKCYLDASSDY